MFKRGILALVVQALLLLVAPTLAAASAAGKSHEVNLRDLDMVSSTGTLGLPGAIETDAGTLAGPSFAAGPTSSTPSCSATAP
ncbi:MAG: hypothetical protein JOZ98_01060 [Solirubrobacterales bacterium]|nr:hypothetical protein [Solirubrobacterales bacterium]